MGLSLPLTLAVSCSLNVEYSIVYSMTIALRDLHLSEVNIQPRNLDAFQIGLGPT
jgi:hypothetical protein